MIEVSDLFVSNDLHCKQTPVCFSVSPRAIGRKKLFSVPADLAQSSAGTTGVRRQDTLVNCHVVRYICSIDFNVSRFTWFIIKYRTSLQPHHSGHDVRMPICA